MQSVSSTAIIMTGEEASAMIVTVSIILGSIIMVGNIIAYFRFIRSSSDVMLCGTHGENVWQKVGLLLLVFFLAGYLGVAFFGKPDYLVASILF